MSTPNPPQKTKQSRSPKRVWYAIVLAKLQSCNQRILPIHHFHLSSRQSPRHFAALSLRPQLLRGRNWRPPAGYTKIPPTSRRDGHLGMRMPKNAENPIGIQTMCVPHIVCGRSMEMYGSFRVLGRTWNKTNQVISYNLTWKVLRLLPKIRNLSQYVPAALAALLVPDG